MNLHVGTGSHLDSIVAKLDAWFGGLLTFLPAYIKKSSFSAAPGSRASFAEEDEQQVQIQCVHQYGLITSSIDVW